MQPYQSASQAIQRQSKEPGDFLKKAGATAASLAVGAPILGKVGSLLNKFVPSGIAAKGLGKLDSRFGQFIDGVIKTGGTQDDALEFIKGKIDQENKPKENRNIVEQYSPQLHKFMLEEIQGGKTPQKAAMLARNASTPYGRFIRQMEKDHKVDWTAIVDSVYGKGQTAQQQPQPQQVPTGRTAEQAMYSQPQSPQQAQGQQQQPQQGGNADQALMAAFDKILKM